ncbi:heavy metal translocating P-type ATPase, partial [Ensifer sp. SSB1]|uniref:heavy metal translocating P-type ATPase n=1 Tax=Ensifer sp. SSB1 TaxID=2795385 RepID=UPI0025BCC1FD
MASTIREARYRVEGMDCASCATKIDTAVRRLSGVEDVSVSVSAGTMSVKFADENDLATSIVSRVGKLGYRLHPIQAGQASERKTAHVCSGHDHDHNHDHGGHSHDHGHDHHDDHAHDHEHRHDDHAHRHEGNASQKGETAAAAMGLHGHDHCPTSGPWWKSGKGKLTIASGLALVAAYAIGKTVPATEPWIFTLAMLVGLLPIARRAFAAATMGTPFSIEMLMTIAAVGAVFIGATEEAAMVVLLFLIGELLEGVAAGKARASIQSLTALVPKSAFVERDGRLDEVPAETLSVGAVILVRPGDRIPADGVVLSGESAVDEAPVTGESTPVRKEADDTVVAGTVNGSGALRVRVTAAAADNTIARIVRMVEEAQESKAPTERFIDRFSRYYTPGVVVVAALVAALPPLLWGGSWDEWIYKGLAILLIGCPCALVISTPAAIAASLSAGARRGLLMKGGAVLENVGKVTAAAFDKTGTLTEGKPKVTDIVGFG